jgi:cellulose synthase/poly-beta-1,6-N-acetylglucosamine synthase-like glycosyltransferase
MGGGHHCNKNSDKNIFVSCMVAVKDEEDHISQCLDSMLRQTYQNKEIIVVNDASVDGTLEILKEYEKAGKIVLINLQNNIGKKGALGRAMAIAKGEIFAHTDSDSIWADDVIEKMVEIFKRNKDVGAISGHGRALNANKNFLTKAQDTWMEGQFSIRKAFESVFGAVTCVSGPLAVFRKEAVFNYISAWENDSFLGQKFKFATDRTLTGFVLGGKAVGEKIKKKYADSFFVKTIDYPARDWKVVYCKSAKSWTIVPDTFKKLMKQHIRWKKSFIRNIFFTGLFYWRKPFLASFVYYLHILFVIFGPFISFRHLIYLPIKGDIFSGVFYLAGIVFISFMFGLAHKLEDKENYYWIYRPVMGLMSTLVISWLIFYSGLTIRKMVWHRI